VTRIKQPKEYIVNVMGVQREYYDDEEDITLRTHIFDSTAPFIILTRTAIDTPGCVLRDVHYAIRDAVTNVTLVPFDTTYNSTRLSSDSYGMFFRFDPSSLLTSRTYVIDLLFTSAGKRTVYKDASSIFKVIRRLT
jgi:hypothetical protein